MLEFLHDGEILLRLLLDLKGDKEQCPVLVEFYHDLKEIGERALKISDARKQRGDTVLISHERLYLVHLILHARADLSKLLPTVCTGTDYDQFCDSIAIGSFQQLKLFQSMEENERQKYYQTAAREVRIYNRFQDYRNDLPYLIPRNRVINQDFTSKVERYQSELEADVVKEVRSQMDHPIPSGARHWFSLQRYASSVLRDRTFIGIESADTNIRTFNGLLANYHKFITDKCGYTEKNEI